MKRQIPLFLGLIATLLFLSCDETETFDDRWKLANEAKFIEISANSEYTKLPALTGKGHVMYKKIESGDGETPLFTDIVKVLYTGWYKNDWTIEADTYTDDRGNVITNKIVFDSTGNRENTPARFNVNGVVPGFSTALQHMQVGDKWEVWIPWELAYGANGRNPIPGHTMLVFEVALMDIVR